MAKIKYYTPAELRTIKSMVKKKQSASKIAKALKRPIRGVYQKAWSIGLSFNA